ncbi:MAG TPA: hypothetical protein VHV75_18345 [Solirubrobacteraceae bacterium]|jgi:hypothetical protein|nr:hypothetical protein [Solirubrobacteraceae bacterium]
MSFKMKWNGDEVARKFAQQAVDANLGALEARIRRDVSALRCPVHAQTPTVVSVTRVGSRLATQVSACCEEMRHEAQRAAACLR